MCDLPQVLPTFESTQDVQRGLCLYPLLCQDVMRTLDSATGTSLIAPASTTLVASTVCMDV